MRPVSTKRTKQRFRDVISDEELRRAYNRIRVDLMDLIDQLRFENMQAEIEEKEDDDGPHTGRLLYRIPQNMELGHESRCIIRVAFDEDTIIKNIELTKNISVKPVHISDHHDGVVARSGKWAICGTDVLRTGATDNQKPIYRVAFFRKTIKAGHPPIDAQSGRYHTIARQRAEA